MVSPRGSECTPPRRARSARQKLGRRPRQPPPLSPGPSPRVPGRMCGLRPKGWGRGPDRSPPRGPRRMCGAARALARPRTWRGGAGIAGRKWGRPRRRPEGPKAHVQHFCLWFSREGRGGGGDVGRGWGDLRRVRPLSREWCRRSLLPGRGTGSRAVRCNGNPAPSAFETGREGRALHLMWPQAGSRAPGPPGPPPPPTGAAPC